MWPFKKKTDEVEDRLVATTVQALTNAKVVRPCAIAYGCVIGNTIIFIGYLVSIGEVPIWSTKNRTLLRRAVRERMARDAIADMEAKP